MLISHVMYRYSEAVGLLYTSNTLNVRQTRTIVGMQKSMLPHRLRMIRSLHIDVPLHYQWKNGKVVGYEESWPENILTFWEPAWSVIAEINGLLNLKVTLSCRTPREIDQETLVHILQPMMTINHVPDFALEIFLPLPEQLLEGVLQSLGGDPPFSVEVKKHIHMPDAPPW